MVSPVRPALFLLLLLHFAAGTIPESIGNLKKLEELWLQENRLTGHLFLILRVDSPVSPRLTLFFLVPKQFSYLFTYLLRCGRIKSIVATAAPKVLCSHVRNRQQTHVFAVYIPTRW